MGSVTKKSKAPATATTPSRHRTLSTPGSVTYIAGYPQKLYIYQLPASKYWWVRYYTGKNTVRRSTKTSNKRDAIAFAKKFFDDITHMQLHGMPQRHFSSQMRPSPYRRRKSRALRRCKRTVYGKYHDKRSSVQCAT